MPPSGISVTHRVNPGAKRAKSSRRYRSSSRFFKIVFGLFPREQPSAGPFGRVLLSPQQTNPAKQETNMTTLRKTLAIAITAATLGFGAIATSSEASARGFGHGGGFHGHFGHFGHSHFGGHRFGFRYGGHRFGHRWGGGHRWGYRWGGGHRWGYHWSGYRRFAGGGFSGGGSMGGAPNSCPYGTHLGYAGRFCWPNR
jgi:hypothetical protein